MAGAAGSGRRVISATGGGRELFLQNLVTNDLGRLAGGMVYAALLTPQGKFLADFFLVPAPDAILIDVKADLADALLGRLGLYRLRADVVLSPTDLTVTRGLGSPPPGALADPRHAALGWRLISPSPMPEAGVDWDAIRVAHCIPESGIELIPDESYILECGFERLNGVDFRKGCFIGQEIVARMKHKTELRKGLVTVRVEGEAPVGCEITEGDRPAGRLFTQSGGRGIAHLRFDRAAGELRAGTARVAAELPAPD